MKDGNMKKILITAPVHQSKNVFKEYLNSLNHLYIPKDYQVNKFFYLHNCPELKDFLKSNEYEEILDNSKYNEFSHDFKVDNYSALSYMRSAALEKARNENYDYVFSVDSDVLLHPKSLQLLLEDNKDIVGMLYWTENGKHENEQNSRIVSNTYDLEYWKCWNNKTLNKKGLYRVGIIMANVLIGSRIIQNKNINYYPISKIDYFTWEDYAFSLKVHCNIPDVQVFIDTRLPSRHLFRERDYIRWIKEKENVEQFNYR